MPTLHEGSSGPLARLFNDFLRSQGFDADEGDRFSARSKAGTQAFQSKLKARDSKVVVDGIPGNQTFGRACAINASDSLSPATIAQAVGVMYPVRLQGLPPTPAAEEMQTLFGIITFLPAKVPSDSDRIRITNNWGAENITSVRIPQLVGIKSAPASGNIKAHRRIAAQLQGVWSAWQARGLLAQIATFDGLWVPRFKRNSARSGLEDLSNHSWGTAFDINASANWLSNLPAFPGENGCLFAHVAIAQAYGFGWGGHYRSRLDGMHFEAVRILSDAEVTALNAEYLGVE